MQLTADPSRWRVIALGVLLLAALLLRSCGLSHDLDQGRVYHPDTPKQIYAGKLFLKGEYYFQTDNINYDGYPYLNSHLVEIVARGIDAGGEWVFDHLGLHSDFPEPGRLYLFWLTRLLNVVLSTATVLLAYLIGKNIFNDYAGLIGALLVTLSPVAIVTTHTAMSDTTAIFFATAAVLFATRIYQQGMIRDYILGAAAVALSFSAKYHGGMSLLPIVLAHGMRFRNIKRLLGVESLIRAFILMIFGLGVFAMATPQIFIDPDQTLKNIVRFFQYTSNFGMRAETEELALPLRCWFGLSHNIPHFYQLLTGPVFILLIPGSVYEIRRRPSSLLILVIPLVYIFFALPFKPLTHPQYHGLATPLMFVLAGGIMTDLWQSSRWRVLGRSATLLVLLISCLMLSMQTRETLFYYQRSDTRLLAETWLQENVPDSFQIAAGDYTLFYTPEKIDHPDGKVMLSSSFRPHKPPNSAAFTNRFNFKDNHLELFRNPVITAYIHSSPWIERSPRKPTYQLYPSQSTGKTIFANSLHLLRTPRVVRMGSSRKVERFVVSDRPIESFVFTYKNAEIGTDIEVTAGGSRQEISLAPFKSGFLEIQPKRTAVPISGNRYIYRITSKASNTPGLLTIAFTPEQKGVALYRIGAYDEALGYLQAACKDSPSPTLKMMIGNSQTRSHADHGSSRSGIAKAEFKDIYRNKSTIKQSYGISPDYLNALPYCEMEINDFKKNPANPEYLQSEIVFLSPGIYQWTVLCNEERNQNPEFNLSVRDARTGKILNLKERSDAFRITANNYAIRIQAARNEFKDKTDAILKIRPDIRKSLQELAEISDTETMTTSQASRSTIPVDTEFEKGIRLTGYSLSQTEVAPGDDIHINTYWTAPADARVRSYAIWIHFLDNSGKLAFQSDRPLTYDLGLEKADGRIGSQRYRTKVPADIPEGKYRIIVGLYYPLRMMRLELARSELDVINDGVLLDVLNVAGAE